LITSVCFEAGQVMVTDSMRARVAEADLLAQGIAAERAARSDGAVDEAAALVGQGTASLRRPPMAERFSFTPWRRSVTPVAAIAGFSYRTLR